MELAEYIIFFVLVVSTGAGIPGPGDAAMIAAGTLAGEGRLNIGVVVVTSLAGWVLGSLEPCCDVAPPRRLINRSPSAPDAANCACRSDAVSARG